MSNRVRVALIGAGEITKVRHVPGLRAIEGVEIAGVVNRTRESSQAVAAECDIPQVYDQWQQVMADRDVDAVVIGTWPNMHCELACAALKAGKHVLVENQMARNLSEARAMLAVAEAHPKLVARVVPSSLGMISENIMDQLMRGHFVGDLREVMVFAANDRFWDYSKPLHWQQDAEIAGRNVLALGAVHETLMRWVPPPVQVYAQAELFEPTRPVPEESRFGEVTLPDSLQIVGELKGGARVMYHVSGVILFGPGIQLHFYGSRGTVRLHFHAGEELIYAGRSEDTELKRIEIPAEERGSWNVEADFIAAIRGQKKTRLTDFATGVSQMEFLEAVALSAANNQPVELPLED